MAFALITARGFCGTDAWWLFHQSEFTNAANFHEIRSTTNLPPEVVSAGRSVNSWTIEKDDSGHPTWAKSWHVIWAVTDGKYYVVHTEYVAVDRPGTNHWIVVARVPDRNGPPPRVHRHASHFVKDFRTFTHELQAEVQAPVGSRERRRPLVMATRWV
jgi:hypothetical protein